MGKKSAWDSGKLRKFVNSVAKDFLQMCQTPTEINRMIFLMCENPSLVFDISASQTERWLGVHAFNKLEEDGALSSDT